MRTRGLEMKVEERKAGRLKLNIGWRGRRTRRRRKGECEGRK